MCWDPPKSTVSRISVFEQNNLNPNRTGKPWQLGCGWHQRNLVEIKTIQSRWCRIFGTCLSSELLSPYGQGSLGNDYMFHFTVNPYSDSTSFLEWDKYLYPLRSLHLQVFPNLNPSWVRPLTATLLAAHQGQKHKVWTLQLDALHSPTQIFTLHLSSQHRLCLTTSLHFLITFFLLLGKYLRLIPNIYMKSLFQNSKCGDGGKGENRH